MRNFLIGETYRVKPGDHFVLILADGMELKVEQTADDFSIVRDNGLVAYRTPTSDFAKRQEDDREQTTGKN